MTTRIRWQHAPVGIGHVGDTAGLMADAAGFVTEDRNTRNTICGEVGLERSARSRNRITVYVDFDTAAKLAAVERHVVLCCDARVAVGADTGPRRIGYIIRPDGRVVALEYAGSSCRVPRTIIGAGFVADLAQIQAGRDGQRHAGKLAREVVRAADVDVVHQHAQRDRVEEVADLQVRIFVVYRYMLEVRQVVVVACLLYTSDAADEYQRV